MADNRISLKCKICGETFYLAKRFSFDGGYYRHSEVDTVELQRFFNKHHRKCSLENLTWHEDIFDIEYEVAPAWHQESDLRLTLLQGALELSQKRIKQLENIVETYEKVQQEFFINKVKEEADHAEN